MKGSGNGGNIDLEDNLQESEIDEIIKQHLIEEEKSMKKKKSTSGLKKGQVLKKKRKSGLSDKEIVKSTDKKE